MALSSNSSAFLRKNITNATSPIQTGNKTAKQLPRASVVQEIKEFVALIYKTYADFLDTLPVSRETILIIGITICIVLFLMICCICCRFCCRKKQEIKQIRGMLNLRKNHLFGPNLGERILTRSDELDYNLESATFNALSIIKLGQIKFSLDFNNEENIVEVIVHEAKDIPAADITGYSDPFVKVILKPAGKKEYRTKVKKRTLNPKFEETFYFKKITYAGLTSCFLSLKLYDDDGLTKSLLGESNIPVADLDLSRGKVTEWLVLIPEFKSEVGLFSKHPSLGHVCIGLGYSPNDSVLAVFILSCKRLKAFDEGGTSDPYVTLFLIENGKKTMKRKTNVKMRTLDPVFNESFPFEIDMSDFEEISLMFIVADYDKGQPGEAIGQCIIGQLGQGLGAKHWEQVRRSPGKSISFWHALRPVLIPEN